MAKSLREERKATERGAFEELFEASYPRVLAYSLRRIDDPAEAEEVTSETFLIAWRRRAELPDQPLPWLLGVARKVAANRRRSLKRRSPGGTFVSLDATAVADPSPLMAEQVSDREIFAAAFAALSPGDREVLALVAWEGLKPGEAAKVIGTTPATFSLRLHRARRRLMKELEAAGHSHSEGTKREPRPKPNASEAA